MSTVSTRSFFVFMIYFLAILVGHVDAAPINGTIEEVSTEDKTVTVKLAGKTDESRTFTLAPTATITIDGKKGKLEDVTEGQTAIIVVNSSDLTTKLTLKTPKAGTTKSSASKTAPAKKTKDEDRPTLEDGASWPQFRGPNRDDISEEKGLLDRWPEGGPTLAWRQKGLGEGYSSISISRGKIYTMGNQGDEEMVIARDLAAGSPSWMTPTGGRSYRDGGQGNGPRGTPTVDDDRVYALGANGDLICVGAVKGERIWQKNILEEYGGSNITWGISESVLIDGNNLICCPGGKEGTMVAIDKMTGRNVWRCAVDGAPKAAYSSPILVEYQGERMYVNYVHTAVIAIRAKDGTILWGNSASANDTANCSSPLYTDGQVFTASGYGTGDAMFKLTSGGKAKLGYTNRDMVNHHGGMVLIDGHVYGFNEQILTCLNLKSGKTVWKDRSVGKGSLTYADGHLYLRGENGVMGLCAATTEGYKETGRFDPPKGSDRPSWSHPVVCGGRLYLRDMDLLLAYDVKK